jgi:hypothetical protein
MEDDERLKRSREVERQVRAGRGLRFKNEPHRLTDVLPTGLLVLEPIDKKAEPGDLLGYPVVGPDEVELFDE